MSDYKNEVTLSGKLLNHKTIETKTGAKIFSASLQTARFDKTKNQWLNSYFNIKAFKDIADKLFTTATMYDKPKITVKGKLSSDEYKDKDGNKRQSFEIIVFDYEILQTTNTQGNKVDAKAVEDVKAYELSKQISDDFDCPF